MARSLLCINLDLGTTKRIWSADFKDLGGEYQVSLISSVPVSLGPFIALPTH